MVGIVIDDLVAIEQILTSELAPSLAAWTPSRCTPIAQSREKLQQGDMFEVLGK